MQQQAAIIYTPIKFNNKFRPRFYDETPLNKELLQHKVTVATVYGRSYFRIINALKHMDLAFESLSPQEAAESNTELVITTRTEAKFLTKKEILLDTDLPENPGTV